MEILVSADQAASTAAVVEKVDGVSHVFISTAPSSNRDGQTVVVAIPKSETVNSQSVGVVKRVKSAVHGLPGVVGVAGVGAAQIDFLHAVYGNFPLMLTIIALLTYLLLARAFRSLLLPFKAVLLNLISLSATLGLMVLFWQDGHGSSALVRIAGAGPGAVLIAVLVIAVLGGRAVGDEVFILSRIREASGGDHATNAAAHA